jgi:hypothetical protein
VRAGDGPRRNLCVRRNDNTHAQQSSAKPSDRSGADTRS